ncbi:MAG TPA: GNAT family N-acetyltransferase [Bacteroidia bacterium]|nr:GNAT family N-acetyltransferase [Bacteroidia bacterium]
MLVPGKDYHIRPLSEKDDLEELTRLLNKSYGKLAERGFRYLASHQDAEMTKQRIQNGHCLVAVKGDRIIGTICYYSPGNKSYGKWFHSANAASWGQFAVDLSLQGNGIGNNLILAAEDLARTDRAEEILIDTAEGAHDLIAFYGERDYHFVAWAQWDETNYRSAVLRKKIHYST